MVGSGRLTVLWSVVSPRVSPPEERRLRALSLWWDALPGPILGRAPLGSDIDVDIAIVGAGFTGLWTAYYLLRGAPDLRVAVLEKEVAGFGASGRNGGWCSALFPVGDGALATRFGVSAAQAMRRAMQETVDEVGARAASEAIDCGFAKGGTVVVARTAAQVQRAHDELAESRPLGVEEDDLRWLSRSEARQLIGVTEVLGATFTPHCAVVDPGRLVRGLAEAVERIGGSIYEGTGVIAVRTGGPRGPAMVRTTGACVRADVVITALEGWTPSVSGQRRALLPIYSLMIATERLPDEFWSDAGLANRETFSDHRRLIIYGQRTADGRLAFGGRGAPYQLCVESPSRVRPGPSCPPVAPHRTCRPLSCSEKRKGHTYLGWALGRGSRLVPLCRFRPHDRAGVGRGLRGRRRVYQQPGRADPGRPGARPR